MTREPRQTIVPSHAERPNVFAQDYTDISSKWGTVVSSNYTFVDIFSGAGGLSYGLQLAGLKGLAGAEIWPAASSTYKHNMSHPCVTGDITAPETKKELYSILKGKKVDILAGGFPCQGFSMAGLRDSKDPRNKLYLELLDLADVLRPAVLIFENVKGILSMQGGNVTKQIQSDFKSIGYDVNFKLLKAVDYGVPQARERVIFIGNNLGKENLFPAKVTDPLPSKLAFAAVPLNDPNHTFTKHTPDMRLRLAKVGTGKSLYPNFTDSWRRIDANKPSPTVKENHGGVFIHPTQARTVTPRELARLQSFPDTYIFKGTRSDTFKQLGNAVPPNLGKAVGLAVRTMLESNECYS